MKVNLDSIVSENKFFINSLNGIMWKKLIRLPLRTFLKENEYLPEEWFKEALRQSEFLSQISLTEYKRRHYSEEWGWGSYKWKGDLEIPKYCMERDILIDTAETYGFGKVEKAISEIEIPEGKKPRILSKIAKNRMSEKAVPSYFNRIQEKFKNFELGVQIHWPSEVFDIKRVWEQFKSYNITSGICNMSLYDLYQITQGFSADLRPDYFQIRINLEDTSFLPIISHIPNTIKILSHSTLNQGLLNLRKNPKYEEMVELSKEVRVPIAVLIPAWVRSYGVIPLIGSNRLSNVVEQEKYRKVKLSYGIIKKIEETFCNSYGEVIIK